MSGKVYELNKNLNKPLTFFGLSSLWIKYAAVILLLNFLLIAISLSLKLPTYLVIGIIVFGVVIPMYFLKIANKKYGEGGLAKYLGSKKVPRVIRSGGRLADMLNDEETIKRHYTNLLGQE